MDTRRQADSLAVSNLTVGTDCSTAVISDCQTKTIQERIPFVEIRYVPCDPSTLGDFRNISTISIFLLAVAPYNFYHFDTKMV